MIPHPLGWGNVQGQVGQALEQRAPVESAPVHGREWDKWALNSLPSRAVPGFHDNRSSWREQEQRQSRHPPACSPRRAHVLLHDGCLLCTNPGTEINCSYTMKRHFIAQALGKANVIRTDIEYKSLAVTHPAITLCSAEQPRAIRVRL